VADICAFYGEAARLVRPSGYVVVLDYHPFMVIRGIPTHLKTGAGAQLAIENWVHFFEDHVGAARTVGLALLEMRERLVDRAWVRAKPPMGVFATRPSASPCFGGALRVLSAQFHAPDHDPIAVRIKRDPRLAEVPGTETAANASRADSRKRCGLAGSRYHGLRAGPTPAKRDGEGGSGHGYHL
jgi:hypothetical protein